MASQAAVEVEGLLENEASPPRAWTGRRLLAFAAAAFAVGLVAAANAWPAAAPLQAAAPESEPEAEAAAEDPGAPPLPAWEVQEKFQVPAGSSEPHIQAPPHSHMMGLGEEGCSHSDEDCVEGDELLDPDQRSARRLAELNGTFGPHARSLMYNPHGGKLKLWPEGVVKYSWDASIDQGSRRALELAMREWEAKTCIRFQHGSAGKGTVRFKSSGQGCNAHVGWSAHYEHHVNLQPPGCADVGVAIHELGHTIGLRHEHARPEALEYISFHLGNAQEWWKQWLGTYHDAGDMSAGLPYDMGSIMHYGAWAGAKSHDGREATKTIKVKKKDVFGNCQVGQREYLSEGDIITANRWYGCPHHVCADLRSSCGHWQGKGFCKGEYQKFMEQNCPHSCGTCECKDNDQHCPGWAEAGYCLRGEAGTSHNKQWMLENCRKSCGNCLMLDAKLCKDRTIWNDPKGCSKHKDGKHNGKPWCQNSWFASQCPESCKLCPHHPFCY